MERGWRIKEQREGCERDRHEKKEGEGMKRGERRGELTETVASDMFSCQANFTLTFGDATENLIKVSFH